MSRWTVISLSLCVLTPFAAADLADDIDDCDSCHGKDGVSTEGDVPTIAGISAFILEEYMFEYAEEGRVCRESEYRSGDTSKPATDMCAVARGLSEEEIPEIAEYYAGKTFVAAKQEFDAAKAAVGAKLHRSECEKCHSDGGSYADDDASILAGQWMPYLEQVFADYASGDRKMLDNKMKEKIDPLDAASIEALIHYYASQQ
ncbi:MAG: cytochrome c4 [Woeseiaceae bacterium]|nr:cytochrome c4 [Woeseiaceae bacterium]